MTNESLTRHTSIFYNLKFHFYIIAALSFAAIFAKLHEGDLSGYDDAVYAHEGREMLFSGDWWNVRLNGRLDFDKPPMFIWMEALSMMIFGVSDWAARFPSALLGFGTIILVYFITRELSEEYWLPIWSMLVLVSTQFFMKQAMHALTGVPCSFFISLAILGYVKGLKEERFFILCGIAIGAAIYTRSILGMIPFAIILIHLLVIRRINLLFSGWMIGGFLLSLGLPLIWFISQYQLYGDEFISRHFSFTLENIPGTDGGAMRRLIFGFIDYPVLLLKNYWPWLPLMILGLWTQAKKMVTQRDLGSSFLVIWVFCVVVPYSLVEAKTLRYLLSAFPAFAILAAITLNSWIPDHRKIFGLKIAYGVLALVMLILLVNPKYRDRPEEMRRLAPVAEAFTSPEQDILLYTKRKPEWAHVHQIIWYAKRRCHLVTEIDNLIARLEQGAEVVTIADKEVFENTLKNLKLRLEVIGETESFVCFRGGQVEASIPNK